MSGMLWNVKNGDLGAVKKLVEQGADLNELISGRTALHFAADYGQTAVLKYLLEKGAKIDEEDKYGLTPVLSAIYEGHVDVVNVLLEKGADVKKKTPDGQSYQECAETDEMKALLKKKL